MNILVATTVLPQCMSTYLNFYLKLEISGNDQERYLEA